MKQLNSKTDRRKRFERRSHSPPPGWENFSVQWWRGADGLMRVSVWTWKKGRSGCRADGKIIETKAQLRAIINREMGEHFRREKRQ